MTRVNLDLDDFKRILNKTEFDEEPVDLETFFSDDYFLGMKRARLSQDQKDIINRMSQIYLEPTVLYLYGEEKGAKIWRENVNEIICEIGKGGGKDFSIRVGFARIIYFLHCLKDPLDYYDKGTGEFIDLINIAYNADQAKNVFFEPLKQLLSQSPYFQEQGFEPRARELYFLNRPIRCFSAHSGVESWEGYNPIAIVLDEIAAFKTDAELQGEKHRYSASAIYDMARNSIISRFPKTGKIALLSFPRYQGDFIEERYNAVILDKTTKKIKERLGYHNEEIIEVTWEKDDIITYAVPKVWAIKRPSFETNPQRSPEDYLASYVDNPIETMGRFFCMPPKAQQAYFRDPARVRKCFPKDVALPIDEFGVFAEWFKAQSEDAPPRFMHIDLGHVRDRAALCMVHCVGKKKVEYFDGYNTVTQFVPIMKMDIIKYWEARPGAEIEFDEVRRFAFDLASLFPIAKITLDRWNSIDTINIFKARGIYSEMHSVDKNDYDTLSTAIHDERLQGYYDEILVDEELLKLQLINGRKIDHPKLGYKDGSDALAGAVWNCVEHTPIEEEIEVIILDQQEEIRQPFAKKKPERKKHEPIPEDLDGFLKRLEIF